MKIFFDLVKGIFCQYKRFFPKERIRAITKLKNVVLTKAVLVTV